MITKKDIHCPTCNKKNTWTKDNTFRPFCSDRCKLIDLGEWADGGYRVPGEAANLHESSNNEDDDNTV